MTRTVDDLRDEIREEVGRFQRIESATFTKEDLAAICDAVSYDIDTTGRLPRKAQMRTGILRQIGEFDEDNVEAAERPFRKAELRSIATALQNK